ncbi:FbpB family small basic protein [Oceanobacillus damuensis]|nr:FbpB family small basic protein [Oceanobacillus damuensis]
MSLKKKLSFDELVAENRKQILQDRRIIEKIENSIDSRMYESLKKANEN